MKRKLLVTVDCDEKECGKCMALHHALGEGWCAVFGNERLFYRQSLTLKHEALRCPACLKAEVKK